MAFKLGAALLFCYGVQSSRGSPPEAQNLRGQAAGECTFRQGAVREDQVCRSDPFYAAQKAFAVKNCDEYAAAGRFGTFVPERVVDDEACVLKATDGETLPNWLRLGLMGEFKCFLQQQYDAAVNNYTNYSNLQVEHIPFQLLVDSDPATRLTLESNAVREVVPDTRGYSVVDLFADDERLHQQELGSLGKQLDKSRYATFMWNHIVNYAIEVLLFRGTGAHSNLASVAPLSRGTSYAALKVKFLTCRLFPGAAASPARGGVFELTDDGITRAMRGVMPQARFQEWESWKLFLRGLNQSAPLVLFNGVNGSWDQSQA